MTNTKRPLTPEIRVSSAHTRVARCACCGFESSEDIKLVSFSFRWSVVRRTPNSPDFSNETSFQIPQNGGTTAVSLCLACRRKTIEVLTESISASEIPLNSKVRVTELSPFLHRDTYCKIGDIGILLDYDPEPDNSGEPYLVNIQGAAIWVQSIELVQ